MCTTRDDPVDEASGDDLPAEFSGMRGATALRWRCSLAWCRASLHGPCKRACSRSAGSRRRTSPPQISPGGCQREWRTIYRIVARYRSSSRSSRRRPFNRESFSSRVSSVATFRSSPERSSMSASRREVFPDAVPPETRMLRRPAQDLRVERRGRSRQLWKVPDAPSARNRAPGAPFRRQQTRPSRPIRRPALAAGHPGTDAISTRGGEKRPAFVSSAARDIE